MAMSDNNVTRKTVLDRLNEDNLDDIRVVEEEVHESTEDIGEENLEMLKRVSPSKKSLKVIVEISIITVNACG